MEKAALTTSDHQALLSLADNDWSFLAELAEFLEEDSKQLTKAIREALKEGQTDRVARKAHALTGILGNVTSGPCFRSAEALEKASKTGDLKKAERLATRLEAELGSLIPSLQEFIAKGSTP